MEWVAGAGRAVAAEALTLLEQRHAAVAHLALELGHDPHRLELRVSIAEGAHDKLHDHEPGQARRAGELALATYYALCSNNVEALSAKSF